ncbi:VanW family protein [Sporosarcina sp. Marseille-Q4943]|uniref:VanW family protein n=1 Tax=Sporosarcina sp. Marseille-Q4943 TaxID=2942204 RepID=UPI00208DBB08|nr:VanW family protein [Sporosarcina sp. Marseille-Q4943]
MSRKTIFLSIASFVVGIGFLSSGVFANNSFSIGRNFDNHTFVGPFNISNNKTKQAKLKLASDLTQLQSKAEVNLIYQDIKFFLRPETITFDIDMTLANANSGEDNPIIANVSREGLATVLGQELPRIHFTEDAIDLIAAGIEKELQTGIMPRNVHITDYLGVIEIPNEVVASSEYSIDAILPSSSKAIHALDSMVILPFESFSMMELLTSPEVGPLSDEEMTLLSSILYSAILQTNFHIDERNISSVISPNIQPGFEAAMNQTLGLDFKFTNPNKTEFNIRASWSAGVIHLSIEGQPFYYTYEPSISNIESYKPRTVRQYSAFVNDGQVVVSQEGNEGVEAVVTRTLSVDGQVVDTENISEDFYAPVHRIEIHPLSKGNASGTDSTDGVETDITQNGGTDAETGTGTSNPGEMESDSSGTIDQNRNDETKKEEVIYDKSGLPIGK